MSRRPVDQVAQSRDAEGRQAIWEAIRALNGAGFRVQDIAGVTWSSPSTIRSYINCLTAGGVLERRDAGDGYRWLMIRDDGYYAPRFNLKGKPVTQGLGVEQMWRTMRILKQFTPRDLALSATTDDVRVNDRTAKAYCAMLLACGYLTCIDKATFEHQATYRLTRNSGPLAPQIQRVKQVFDPNTKTVHRKGDA